MTEREKLLRRALFLADATRLLGSLDVEPALDSVAHLSVPFIGDGCAIDLLGNGQPRRLLVVSREGAESFSPELHSAVLAGHSAIYTMGPRSCMAVPLVVKGAVTGAMTFVGPRMRRYNEHDLEFAETLARRDCVTGRKCTTVPERRKHSVADEFLAIAAHEIRGLITSVHMAVQGLQRGKVTGCRGASTFWKLLNVKTAGWLVSVDELLDLGRIQTGQIYFNFERSDRPRRRGAQAINTLGDELAKAALGFRSRHTASRSASGTDSDSTQVVTNLLSNAIKFGARKTNRRHGQGASGLYDTRSRRTRGSEFHPKSSDSVFKPF